MTQPDSNRSPEGHLGDDSEQAPTEVRSKATAEVRSDVTGDSRWTRSGNIDIHQDRLAETPNRTARIARDGSAEPLGAAVWLTADELAAIGIDVDNTDAVEVHVLDGDLQLVPRGGDGDR